MTALMGSWHDDEKGRWSRAGPPRIHREGRAANFETDPVVTVRENFVACALAITARHGQPAFSTYRRMRAAGCRTSGPYLRKPRVIYLYLSRRHDHAVQMDTRERHPRKYCRNNLRNDEGSAACANFCEKKFRGVHNICVRSMRH